jgi:hypothetical protein
VPVKTYIVYDQEPVRVLLDAPAILIGMAIPFFLMVILYPTHLLDKSVWFIIFLLFWLASVIICATISSKYITSNKIAIDLNDESLQVSYFRKKAQKFNKRIFLKDIIKIDNISSHFGGDEHFRIHYSNDRIFTITKKLLYFLIHDDLESFKKDLNDRIKNKN